MLLKVSEESKLNQRDLFLWAKLLRKNGKLKFCQ